MHQRAEIQGALRLVERGLSDYEVARRVDIPRSTVQRWRCSGAPRRSPAPLLVRPLDPAAYSYLLGLYLGDGHISAHPPTLALSVTLDTRYPSIISACQLAIERTAGVKARVRDRPGCRVVYAYSASWSSLIPQHGRGKKHLRTIRLEGWQRIITSQHPRELLRGLIHSDGCRCLNRFSVRLPSGQSRRYEYSRYFFVNLSDDIRQIFCDHCELVGVRWTQSNHKNISVSQRGSVAILDSFIGPKS